MQDTAPTVRQPATVLSSNFWGGVPTMALIPDLNLAQYQQQDVAEYHRKTGILTE
jgi:hypothetical protein